jgi:hypothetical protein
MEKVKSFFLFSPITSFLNNNLQRKKKKILNNLSSLLFTNEDDDTKTKTKSLRKKNILSVDFCLDNRKKQFFAIFPNSLVKKSLKYFTIINDDKIFLPLRITSKF